MRLGKKIFALLLAVIVFFASSSDLKTIIYAEGSQNSVQYMVDDKNTFVAYGNPIVVPAGGSITAIALDARHNSQNQINQYFIGWSTENAVINSSGVTMSLQQFETYVTNNYKNGNFYFPGDTITPTKDMKLYSVWCKAEIYDQVKYPVIYQWTVEAPAGITLPAGITVPVNSNLYFEATHFPVDMTYTSGMTVQHLDANGIVDGIFVFEGWNNTNGGVMPKGGITITGKWVFHQYTRIQVTKAWDDKNNQDGIRPGSITVHLYANTVDTAQTAVLSEGNGWTAAFSAPEKDGNGAVISYTVAEEGVDAYTPVVTGTAAAGYLITNTHVPAVRTIQVTKSWSDANDADRERTGKVTVHLYADGVDTSRTVELNAGNGWTAAFENLDVNHAGTPIAYTVVEDAVNGYQTVINDAANGYTITNTRITTVQGTKTWLDDSDKLGLRPASVTLTLKADGSPVAAEPTWTNTAANQWTYTYTNLQKYHDDGTPINYTVEETLLDGIPLAQTKYRSVQNGYNFTNTLTDTTVIQGTKTWLDDSDRDELRPSAVTLTLKADGTEVTAIPTWTDTDTSQWTYTYENLPMYTSQGVKINYTVEETLLDGIPVNQTKYRAVQDGYNITNTLTDTTSIQGTKTWLDDSDRDELRPSAVTLTLKADRTEVTAIPTWTDTDTNQWTYTYDDLPMYNSQGVKITYTVEETLLDGIPVSQTKYHPVQNGFDITNTLTDTTAVRGSKIWADDSNRDGIRPTSIAVTIKANNVALDPQPELTWVKDGNTWTYTSAALPKYDAQGVKITYTVAEAAVTGYATTYNGFTITNTHEPRTTTVAGTKTWDDNHDQDGIRPDTLTLILKADGETVTPQPTPTWTQDGDTWTYAYTDLPYNAAGKKINYTVSEAALDGYAPSYTGFNITNIHTPGTTSISGTKIWNDGDNQDGIRPLFVTLILKADNVVMNPQPTPAWTKEGSTWTYSYANLAEKANGRTIIYTVEEAAVDGYTTAYNGYTITNTHVPSTISVSGAKIWDDQSNQDGIRPASIDLTLKADGTALDPQPQPVWTKDTDTWNYTYTDLPEYASAKKITYTVTEAAVEGYTTSYNGYQITNQHIPEQITLSGTKTWTDNNDQDGIRPDEITVYLVADNVITDRSAFVKEGLDGSWTYTFTDLDKYADGTEINYSVTEDPITDYSSAVTGMDIENIHQPVTITVEGTKTWDDADDQDGIRPSQITVHLLANGADTQQSAVVTEDTDGNWKYSFIGVPKNANGSPISYTVSEDPVEGYAPTVTGMDINNVHTPALTTVSGIKTWTDNNDQDGIRPEQITVHLLANGNDTGLQTTVKPDADGSWKYSFTDVALNADGKPIDYTVTEDAVTDYSSAVTGMNLENIHRPVTITVEGIKTWDDADNQDGIRPEQITLHLLADDQDTGLQTTVTPAADGTWKYSFIGVPKNANGSPISYTVQEDPVDGYTPEAAGMNITNTHIPAVITVSGIKTWNDEDDVDSIRPPEITVHLLADGTDTGSYAVVTPADDGTWTYAFADVDQYANGKEIVYTVSEDAVEGYTTVVDGMNITNTHTRPATPLTPPERPDTPKTPDTVRRPSTPNTGDETNAPLFAGMMGAALLAAAVAFLLRKKYTN